MYVRRVYMCTYEKWEFAQHQLLQRLIHMYVRIYGYVYIHVRAACVYVHTWKMRVRTTLALAAPDIYVYSYLRVCIYSCMCGVCLCASMKNESSHDTGSCSAWNIDIFIYTCMYIYSCNYVYICIYETYVYMNHERSRDTSFHNACYLYICWYVHVCVHIHVIACVYVHIFNQKSNDFGPRSTWYMYKYISLFVTQYFEYSIGCGK